MFKNFFKPKSKVIELFSPLNGTVINISEVPDPVFSEKMMGDGFAVIPNDGELVSPVKGKIIQVFPTKHAICIETEDGLEMIIHVGLDTVELNGEGFEVLVGAGDNIEVGDPLLNIDLEFLIKNNKEIVTPVIIANHADKIKSFSFEKSLSEIKCKDLVLRCELL